MPPAKKDPDNPKTIDDVITQYGDEMKKSLDSYVELAKNAGQRLSGAEQPKTSWADDAVTYWARVARDQTLYFNAVNQVIRVATQPKDDDG